MKKIVLLNGSPHAHGCTAALAEAVVKSAEVQGAVVKSYYLNGMNIRGCQGCFQCAETGRCVQEDDMQPIYDDILEADGIILASPVFMWSMCAQLKTAGTDFSRSAAGSYKRSEAGQKGAALFTQGQRDTDMFRHYFEHVAETCSS
jgi:multimeric flavodoxin WrbA